MPQTRNYDLVIWDWNGTLLDDTETCFAIANEMRLSRGMEPMASLESYRAVFRFPIIEYYRKMGYTFETESFEDISREFVAHYAEQFPLCTLQPNAIETLSAVLERGAQQVLLSATGQEKLDEQVRRFSLGHYFGRIIGGQNDLAHGKADYAQSFLLDSGVSSDRVLFVGDTDHDFEIARSVGADCALLVPGHQSRKYLETLGARLIDSLCEVPSLL